MAFGHCKERKEGIWAVVGETSVTLAFTWKKKEKGKEKGKKVTVAHSEAVKPVSAFHSAFNVVQVYLYDMKGCLL